MPTDPVAVAAAAVAADAVDAVDAVEVEFAVVAAEYRLLIDYVVMFVADFARYLAAHSMGRIHCAMQEMTIETVGVIENKNFDLSRIFITCTHKKEIEKRKKEKERTQKIFN